MTIADKVGSLVEHTTAIRNALCFGPVLLRYQYTA